MCLVSLAMLSVSSKSDCISKKLKLETKAITGQNDGAEVSVQSLHVSFGLCVFPSGTLISYS